MLTAHTVSLAVQAAQNMDATPTSDPNGDPRSKGQHSREDSHFIAEYLAQNSSKAAAVFRRYDKLAVYRIIRLSQELRSLEREHDLIVEGEIDPEDPERYAEFDFRVGSKIQEYYDLLISYSQVLHLEPPAERTVEALERHITSPELHHNQEWWGHKLKYKLPQQARARTFPDLVSLYTPAENDYLSKFVDKFLYPFFTTPESTKEAKYVNEQKLQRFVTFAGTVFSIGFLIAAMWVLWRLHDHMIAKLATVTGFVVAFATWLGFLTTAQRKDVIAATAAYAAVLVVFVSQQG
ncbi:hypothetical protein K505DRAFT_372595 [Melanomma pulvis-pyrius CBS 109.77]|uniref:DUF6594 domain-containing protein n=1 Tax=Melanomma pulvis-pyrius CBS 109.77 TaxID=1314802 RepID=A0A6A6XM84_9PLEO|nr:hypothetical protein K505DRAFT_372595 [Melanomma pulvis-pyrius CBS 109.77]